MAFGGIDEPSVLNTLICQRYFMNLLSCNTSREFWIHFETPGVIRIGEGTNVGDIEVMRCEDQLDDKINANSVSISTPSDVSAIWSLSTIKGNHK